MNSMFSGRTGEIYFIEDGNDNDDVERKADHVIADASPVTSRRRIRKYVIIIVPCCVVVLVLGAVLTTQFLVDYRQKVILTFQRQFIVGNASIEDKTYVMRSKEKALSHSYHIVDSTGESWGITDFSKRTMVIKFEEESGQFVCVVDTNRPEVDHSLLCDYATDEPVISEEVEKNASLVVEKVSMSLSTEPYNDTSMTLLGPAERALCVGTRIYGINQPLDYSRTDKHATTAVSPPPQPSRHRRYYVCRTDFSHCSYSYLPGDSWRVYFICPRVCTNHQ